MKKIFLLLVVSLYYCTFITAQNRCVEIESILVDACGSPEGKNEMFRFRVGQNNLNTSNLSITWDSNPWLGVCQNNKTAQDVAALNRTILSCGLLIEPVAGVLPAGREVLFITSENMDTLANSFTNLQDTLIVIFQCGNASTGHFRNYATGVGTRTTILSFSGINGGADTVTYEVDHLVGQNGNHTIDDGALVNFTNSVPTSYTNNGCNAPVPQMSVQILTPDTTICKGGSIALHAIAANYKNVKWKGGMGTFSSLDSLNTVYIPATNEIYPITLTIKAYKKCTADSLSDAIVISKFSNTTTAGNNIAICRGSNTTLTATGGVSYVWDSSPYLGCVNCQSVVASPLNTTIFFANVTDSHTCINRDSVTVTVNSLDTIIVAAYDTICTGGSIVLSAFSTNGYSWTPATNLTCTNCPSPTANPSASINYLIASLGVCPTQKQVHVNVLLPNVVNINSTGTTLTCTSNSITLTANSNNSGLGYNWGSGINTAVRSVNTSGTYTVTATDPSFGCTATASAVINQNISLPNASIGSHGSLSCNVSSVTLTASSNTPNASYNWGSGNTSSINTVSSTGTYTVTITDPANGCTTSASTTVTSVAGTVSFTSSSSNATCGNSNGSATVTVLSGTSPYAYLWNNNGNTANISSLTAGTYTITVTDFGGCSATGSVVVNATNALSANISSTNTTCGLNNGAATVTPTSGNSPYTYLWSNNANTSSLSNLSGGTYSLTITDVSGCSTTASVAVQSTSVNPVIVVSDTSVICSGDSAHVCATYGFIAYQWNTGQTTSCIYTKNAGNYYVTATDNNNCTVASNHIAVNVHPQPPVSISVNGDTLTAYNSFSYQWYYNNTILPGATSPVYLANQNGLYTVAITDTNGCHAYSLPVQITISGIDAIETMEGVKVYPNPIEENGFWNLETKENLNGSLCEIYDASGKLVYQREVRSTRLQIELNIAKGIYLLKIISGKTTMSFRLVRM